MLVLNCHCPLVTQVGKEGWDRAFACNIAKALENPAIGLVIGIIGKGHLEYGYGTPAQLQDLGIDKQAVLLTTDDPLDQHLHSKDYARAVYHLPKLKP